jgi:hypothetical protein
MKRFAIPILSFALGTLVLAPLSYGGPAGKFERRYWDPSVEQNAPMKEKSFQHTSPTQRDQKEMSTPQKGATNPNQSAGKYDRRYWTPTQE